MGVNYEKMNSSAFRSGRRRVHNRDDATQKIIPAGTGVFNGTLGDGVTMEDFISGSDNVVVRYSCGEIIERGSSVIKMIADYARFHRQPGASDNCDEMAQIADAYDAAQAARGDSRRAYRG